jgi:hypothetical protein
MAELNPNISILLFFHYFLFNITLNINNLTTPIYVSDRVKKTQFDYMLSMRNSLQIYIYWLEEKYWKKDVSYNHKQGKAEVTVLISDKVDQVKKIKRKTKALCNSKKVNSPIKHGIPGPGTVAHTCNHSYLGDGDSRIAVQGQPGPKVSKNLSEKHQPGLARFQWFRPVINLAAWKLRSRGSRFQDSSGKKKFVRSHFNGKKLGMVACACHPNDGRLCKIVGLWSRLAWAKN